MSRQRQRCTRLYLRGGVKSWSYRGDKYDIQLILLVRTLARVPKVCEACHRVIASGDGHIVWRSVDEVHTRCLRPSCRPERSLLTRDPIKIAIWSRTDQFSPLGVTPPMVAREMKDFADAFAADVLTLLDARAARARNAGEDAEADDVTARITDLNVYCQNVRGEAESVRVLVLGGTLTIEDVRVRAVGAVQNCLE